MPHWFNGATGLLLIAFANLLLVNERRSAAASGRSVRRVIVVLVVIEIALGLASAVLTLLP